MNDKRNTTPEEYLEQINWYLEQMKEDPRWRSMLEEVLGCANRVYIEKAIGNRTHK